MRLSFRANPRVRSSFRVLISDLIRFMIECRERKMFLQERGILFTVMCNVCINIRFRFNMSIGVGYYD